MYRLLGVCGSLRAGSLNAALLTMAGPLVPPDLALETYEGIGDLPHYQPGYEDDLPAEARRWRDAVQAADALLLAAPEYNFGPSGVMKNALDWASRPPGQHVLQGKVVAVVTAGGSTGGVHAQEYLQNILGLLGNTVVSEPVLAIKKASGVLAPDGTASDPSIVERLGARLVAVSETLRSR